MLCSTRLTVGESNPGASPCTGDPCLYFCWLQPFYSSPVLRRPRANPCSKLALGQEGSFNGFVPFPSNSLWNTNIANAQVDPNSAAIINFIGSSQPLHPDFGSGLYDGQTIGIPYIVVPATQPPVNINFTAYGDESDPGPMPIPFNAPIEGYPNPGDGDRHVLVVDRGNCWLYELYGAYEQNPGLWNAASGAVWDLTANEQRPYTWTSADAAGLPILPGLVRYDEIAAGCDPTCHPLHAAIQSRSIYAARVALGCEFRQPASRADGHAAATES